MYSVATQERLASAAAVFGGPHGAVSQLAQQRRLSRQALYRQAHHVARAVEGSEQTQQLHQLQEQVRRLRHEVDTLRSQLAQAVLITEDKQAEFAALGQAEGVSLPLARRLLQLFLKERTPSVATLGRATKAAARRATAALAVLDDHSNPRVRDAALDELFVGQRPVLMAVELDSLVWAAGRLSPSRDGDAWAEQLRKLPALQFVSRDAGVGLDAGIARLNAERSEKGQEPLFDQDDHFHLLREGTRALRRLQGQASRALEAAEKADKARARVARQGRNQSGTAGIAGRAWKKAEAAFARWSAADLAWTGVRQQALPLFTPSGQLNTRVQAEAVVAQALEALDGPEWAKVRRLLQRPGFFTFLDRVSQELAALPSAPELGNAGPELAGVAAPLVRAALAVEGGRRRPEASRGPGASAAACRLALLLAAVTLARAGPSGAVAQTLVRAVLRRAWRASSAVEGLNSVVRMHQGRHRRLTQGLLDLKRLNWNCRAFRTGKRKKQTPYGRLGLQLPTSDWWQLLKIPPEQLRQQLSAPGVAA